MSIGLVAILFGVTVFIAVYAIMAPVNQLRDDSFQVDTDREAGGGLFERLVRPAIRSFLPQTPLSVLTKARSNSKVAELLVRSGNPWNVQPEEFWAIRVLAAVVGAITFLLLGLGDFLPSDLGLGFAIPALAWAAIGAALGHFIPKVLLDKERGKRRKAAQHGLPEALDLLIITLNAGQNFSPALTEVVNRLPAGLVRDELRRVSADMRTGKSMDKALVDFARRAPSEEVESFCRAVVQAERLGSDVSDTLKGQAEAARASSEAALDVRIGKLQTTLFFPILGLMLPALFLVLLAPAFTNLSQAFG